MAVVKVSSGDLKREGVKENQDHSNLGGTLMKINAQNTILNWRWWVVLPLIPIMIPFILLELLLGLNAKIADDVHAGYVKCLKIFLIILTWSKRRQENEHKAG
jgi:hypothetical protein